jgi:hypothetical protein
MIGKAFTRKIYMRKDEKKKVFSKKPAFSLTDV